MTPCACRDCFEITVANSPVTHEIYNEESEDYEQVTTTPPALCWECVDADCLAYNADDESQGVPSYSYACQRES